MATEEMECVAFVKYLEMRNLKFSHLAQSTFTKSWSVKARNKRLGVVKGVCDYMVIVKDKLVFIEMKRMKGGRLSPEQKEWIEALQNCKGVSAFVAKGAAEGIEFIETCINNPVEEDLRQDLRLKVAEVDRLYTDEPTRKLWNEFKNKLLESL